MLNDNQIQTMIKSSEELVRFTIENAFKRARIEDAVENLKKIFPQFFSSWISCSEVRTYFKCNTIEEMTPIIRYLTNVCGFHQKEEKKQEGLTSTWKLWDGKAVLIIETTFSGKCRMVQVGEETITRPVMEMQCGDEPKQESSAPTDNPDLPF